MGSLFRYLAPPSGVEDNPGVLRGAMWVCWSRALPGADSGLS